ncbi:PREDICTED: uncharacterized protein LOC105448528 [Wasmannia auropunctata]|uniref:uncharacterized protein LOC105448528 n=1 Tax=Wasmannia auropunctata TaxID=64793 RepID=UPI0005ED620D|nr:PREDICTED: uncharacterized protein LOC105448528 [Wasmannia auropunctata]
MRYNAQCIYETLPHYMLTVMILVKIFTYHFNSRKVRFINVNDILIVNCRYCFVSQVLVARGKAASYEEQFLWALAGARTPPREEGPQARARTTLRSPQVEGPREVARSAQEDSPQVPRSPREEAQLLVIVDVAAGNRTIFIEYVSRSKVSLIICVATGRSWKVRRSTKL